MAESLEPSLHEERRQDPAAFARRIEQLRDAVGEYLETTSLREAAREIGMSPTGLANFVNGATPYTHTIGKLRAWQAARSRP
jgi:hypothetical protein